MQDGLTDALRECASGRELSARGYGEDVELAAARDVVHTVPVLDQGRFHAVEPSARVGIPTAQP